MLLRQLLLFRGLDQRHQLFDLLDLVLFFDTDVLKLIANWVSLRQGQAFVLGELQCSFPGRDGEVLLGRLLKVAGARESLRHLRVADLDGFLHIVAASKVTIWRVCILLLLTIIVLITSVPLLRLVAALSVILPRLLTVALISIILLVGFALLFIWLGTTVIHLIVAAAAAAAHLVVHRLLVLLTAHLVPWLVSTHLVEVLRVVVELGRRLPGLSRVELLLAASATRV